MTQLIERRSDAELADLMTNLGGHDLPSLCEAFETARAHDRCVCFIAYTIKGKGLPLQGHKDNHSGLLTPTQLETYRDAIGVRAGHEWDAFEGLEAFAAGVAGFHRQGGVLLAKAAGAPPRRALPCAPCPRRRRTQASLSTQAGFGLMLNELARGDDDFASRVVTTSPDVTVSTNLGAWVNRRQLYARQSMADVFKRERIPSTYTWEFTPQGQHIELGIAENNLFILLSALGLSHALFGERLLPIGTLYDPFICARPRCAELCLLSGRALSAGGDAVGRDAGAGGWRAPVDLVAFDWIGAGRAVRLRARLRRRTRGDDALCVRLHAARRRWPLRQAERDDLAARRDRRLGVSAAHHATDRSAAARR